MRSNAALTPREFCQEQLRLLGDEDLPPSFYEATLEILHSTIMEDSSASDFETRLIALSQGETPVGAVGGQRSVGAAAVARVLLETWIAERALPPAGAPTPDGRPA